MSVDVDRPDTACGPPRLAGRAWWQSCLEVEFEHHSGLVKVKDHSHPLPSISILLDAVR